MPSITDYVVPAFDRDDKNNRVPRHPIEQTSEGAARTVAIALARQAAGIIAFSRTGNPDEGEYGPATIIHPGRPYSRRTRVTDLVPDNNRSY